jgi:hypothetical protein
MAMRRQCVGERSGAAVVDLEAGGAQLGGEARIDASTS